MRDKRVRMMTEMGLAVALAAILNMLPLFKMPQGGSVSLEMLPVLIIALRWGAAQGMVTGLVYGLVQLVMGAYIVHPIQLILDYPLAYLLVGLAGLVSLKDILKKGKEQQVKLYLKVLGALLIGGGARLLSHIISGVVFFGEYAPEGQNVWLYSTVYNGSFILPSLLISFVIIVPLLKSLILLDE